MIKQPLYPNIKIDWKQYDRDPVYADAADQILMEMRDTFQGWEEEGFDPDPLDQYDYLECVGLIGVLPMVVS